MILYLKFSGTPEWVRFGLVKAVESERETGIVWCKWPEGFWEVFTGVSALQIEAK